MLLQYYHVDTVELPQIAPLGNLLKKVLEQLVTIGLDKKLPDKELFEIVGLYVNECCCDYLRNEPEEENKYQEKLTDIIDQELTKVAESYVNELCCD